MNTSSLGTLQFILTATGKPAPGMAGIAKANGSNRARDIANAGGLAAWRIRA